MEGETTGQVSNDTIVDSSEKMLIGTVASEISRPYLNKRINHKNKIQFLRDSNIY